VIQIGHSITAFVNDLTVLDYGKRAAWSYGRVPLGEGFVCLVDQTLGSDLLIGLWRLLRDRRNNC